MVTTDAIVTLVTIVTKVAVVAFSTTVTTLTTPQKLTYETLGTILAKLTTRTIGATRTLEIMASTLAIGTIDIHCLALR